MDAVEVTGGDTTIYASEIVSYSGKCLNYNGSGALLKVIGAKLISVVDSAIWYEVAGDAQSIRLRDCLLISDTSFPSVDANGGSIIQCVNVWANHAEDSGSITVYGALNTDLVHSLT
jgi:hypothetical protein